MTDTPFVRVKGVGNRLWVSVDGSQPQERIKEEIENHFSKMNNLVNNARVVIDTGDPENSRKIAEELNPVLKSAFSVQEVIPPPESVEVKVKPVASVSLSSDARKRKFDMDRSWQNYRSDVLMLAGRVRAGQKVTAKNHLVIMGDVNPGAEVSAGGDIIVLGSLCGKAQAGQPDNIASIVLSLDLRPTQLQIGGIVAAGLNDGASNGAEYAHVEEGSIVVDNYLKVSPFKRIQWPEVR
jgi:septum site-determining protein MinC